MVAIEVLVANLATRLTHDSDKVKLSEIAQVAEYYARRKEDFPEEILAELSIGQMEMVLGIYQHCIGGDFLFSDLPQYIEKMLTIREYMDNLNGATGIVLQALDRLKKIDANTLKSASMMRNGEFVASLISEAGRIKETQAT